MVDGPLSGVRVLDLTHVWAGPLAVRMLGDLGADVVRVEAPDGRGPREFPYTPLGGWIGGDPGDEPWNRNAIFVKLMRNRRSLCLDLKHAAGREVFERLVAQADVLVENFSAGTLARLGMGKAQLASLNPRLIYVCMPGFGSTGPLSDRVAFGPTVEAMSGLSDVFGYGADEPRNTAMALMDPISGCNAVAAVTAALHEREIAGTGAHIEMSLHEGGVCYNGPWLIDLQLGEPVECHGNRHPAMAPHGVYPCAGDDAWVAIACADDAQWRNLAVLIGQDPQLSLADRQLHHDSVDAALERWLEPYDKHEATERLQAAGVSAGPVNDASDLPDDAQIKAREFFVPYERGGTPMPGNPLHMSGLNPNQWIPCPALGADNAAVLEDWLNYTPEQIQTLHTEGVLHTRPPA